MAVEFYRSTKNSRYVSIYSNGVIQISSRAVNDFKLNEWGYAMFGYDAETKEIVLRMCAKDEFGGLALKAHSVGMNKIGAASMNCKKAFVYFGISISDYCGKRYQCLVRDELICISLKKTILPDPMK